MMRAAIAPMLMLLALGGCERSPAPGAPVTPAPTGEGQLGPPAAAATPPVPAPSGGATPAPSPAASPNGTASGTPTGPPVETRSCRQATTDYASAIAARDFAAAAAAWSQRSRITPATLEAAYRPYQRPRLTAGAVQEEGAAGSIYCTAEVTVSDRAGAGETRSGSLTWRRVNDVPGAKPWQLRWHLTGSSVNLVPTPEPADAHQTSASEAAADPAE